MESYMYNDCSIGILPADLMRPIVFKSNWNGAMAVALSCKYWYKEFRDKVVHPTLAFTAVKEWWLIKQGRKYGVTSGQIWDTEFTTVEDIIAFKANIKNALEDEKKIERYTDNPDDSAAILKYRDVDGVEEILTRRNGSLKISLLDNFVEFSLMKNELDERPGNIIKINVCQSNIPSIALSVYIDIWGNIEYSYVKCRAAVRHSVTLKRDPKLFFDLRDILVYTKNAKSIEFPSEKKDEDSRSFTAGYFSPTDKKSYQVQHLIVTKSKNDEPVAVHTNDYKKDALAKIIRLVSVALTGNLERFEMNQWAATSPFVTQWNSLIIRPITLRSSMKEENLSCVDYVYFAGKSRTDSTNDTFVISFSSYGRIQVSVYRNVKNTWRRYFVNNERHVIDVDRLQRVFSEFEVVDRVRNARDRTELPYHKLDKKIQQKITHGLAYMKQYPLKEAFYGARFVEACYFPFLAATTPQRSVPMSKSGFDLMWPYCVDLMVKELSILPANPADLAAE